ncbi:MAG: tRNA uridine-5-carboxymethylaminomethyl(34) synthesis GTPase MnmE [Gemmobacter sp.]|uniref:tRNA uridine-5-carboxymethylaminomethyl(34) synthesis GTPase MnmE n=1 Tax=Gemmobacter sp. TaxID=1898957 RepID=UPI00391B03CA
METIYALATGRGKAGVAIVRVSGPAAVEGLLPLVGSFGPPRRAVLRRLRDGDDVLDEALVLRFEAEHSFTGEEVVELQLHGSPAIAAAVLDRLSRVPGFRMAEAGEFTRRALENGRLDLAQVEGLSDLIQAETEAQRRQAMRVFSGAVGEKALRWRALMLRSAALLEAALDFADEDVPVDVYPEVRTLIALLLEELRAEQAGYAVSERIRDGFEVAILGAPNAGKSTLLNRLAGREAALTSEYAGTTRDVIEVRMDLAGLPVTLLDTAGLRSAADPVEAMGIARGIERARNADLRIFLVGPDDTPGELALRPGPDDLVVHGKADLHAVSGLAISGLTGEGVDILVKEVESILARRAGAAATITRERHRTAVRRSIEALESAQAVIMAGEDNEEVAADALRQAMAAMDDLVGRIGVEDLLGEIFASFCIGK